MDKNSIEYVDKLSGRDFEFYTARLLKECGYKIEKVTKSSGDQGVDVIAINDDGQKIAVQCKHYAYTVGNKAVQEVYTGMGFRGLNGAMVVTNSTFSNSAIKLANKLNIKLWDRNTIVAKLNEINDAQDYATDWQKSKIPIENNETHNYWNNGRTYETMMQERRAQWHANQDEINLRTHNAHHNRLRRQSIHKDEFKNADSDNAQKNSPDIWSIIFSHPYWLITTVFSILLGIDMIFTGGFSFLFFLFILYCIYKTIS